MPTIGALLSQQLGFTVTTSGGTVYTHGLGFTPTLILLTCPQTQTATPVFAAGYTLANSVTVTISSNQAGANLVDVLCGSIHSLIR